MSRDCPSKPEEFDTKEGALTRFKEIKEHFITRMGHKLWIASIKAPGQEKWETIEPVDPYF